jgi:hypothetical protein
VQRQGRRGSEGLLQREMGLEREVVRLMQDVRTLMINQPRKSRDPAARARLEEKERQLKAKQGELAQLRRRENEACHVIS